MATTTTAAVTTRNTLALANIGVSIAAFGVATAMGFLQSLSIADVNFPKRGEELYYLSVTAHGVLMALVFTTFFIMGLGYVLAQEGLGEIRGRAAGWVAYWLAVAGSVSAAATILAGKATVLYTFYPPLQAHPLFYIGATVLVVVEAATVVVVFAELLPPQALTTTAPPARASNRRRVNADVTPAVSASSDAFVS